MPLMTATNTPPERKPKRGFLSRLGFDLRKWRKENTAPAEDITVEDTVLYGAGVTTAAALLGDGKRGGRARQIIYEKWMRMEQDPIISSAIQTLVTAALGGHETTGSLVFIEKKPETKESPELEKIVEEIAHDLEPIFNRVAFPLAYTACVYGDAYARIYANDKEGVISLAADELVRPQLVQPFEQAGRTVGYGLYLGPKNFERLDITQMARMKMPRTQWIPQFGVVEKSLAVAITEDDMSKAPILPALVGGSLLYNAEVPYDNLIASLIGLVSSRLMDSIDEQMVLLQMDGSTDDQRRRFVKSLHAMLLQSKALAENAVKNNRPVLDRVRHIIPVHNEKQVTTFSTTGNGQGRTTAYDVNDVLLHARLLAGALGVDLSMLGFADQMSGGLGEGGFFRVSAQAAERSRIIRVALEDFFDSVIDIHTLKRYGVVFRAGERPWDINFYSSISALESEKQRTRMDAMNSGSVLIQAIQMAKDQGFDKKQLELFLTKEMLVDEDRAKEYARIVEKKVEEDDGSGNEGGGRFGEGM